MSTKTAKRSLLFVSLLFVLSAGTLVAQQKTVTGKITDVNGTPVEGATITIARANAATTSNAQGMFSLNYNSSSTTDLLTVTSVGFGRREQAITNGQFITIELPTDARMLADVVVTGVG